MPNHIYSDLIEASIKARNRFRKGEITGDEAKQYIRDIIKALKDEDEFNDDLDDSINNILNNK